MYHIFFLLLNQLFLRMRCPLLTVRTTNVLRRLSTRPTQSIDWFVGGVAKARALEDIRRPSFDNPRTLMTAARIPYTYRH